MHVFSSLYNRLLLALFIVLLLFSGFTLWMTHKSAQSYFYEFNQRLNSPIAMYMVNNSGLIKNGELNPDDLSILAEHVMTINPSVDVFLLDSAGNVLAQTPSDIPIITRTVSLEPLQQFLSIPKDPSAPTNKPFGRFNVSHQQYPVFGDNPREIGLKSVFSVYPLVHEGNVLGYVYAVLSGPVHRTLFKTMMFGYSVRNAALTTLGALLFTMVGGGILFFVLTRKLRVLSDRVDQWQCYYHELEDNLDNQKIDSLLRHTAPSRHEKTNQSSVIMANDEISRLSASYESMMAKLTEHLLALKHSDTSRRYIFASISHDLRTPLTSIQGYLETVIYQSSKLDNRLKERYLSIALKQSKRLGALFDDVLELSKLNSGEMKFYAERFNIMELAHDCVQDFTLRAKKKNVVVNVLPQYDAGHQFWTNADLALIYRVFYNVLNNAFRFTPDGGRIFIHLEARLNDICISIVDTGLGMSEEDASLVFMPYYTRTEETGLKRKLSHTGLGLAISRKIIELHGGRISLISRAGVGSVFRFSLPLACDL